MKTKLHGLMDFAETLELQFRPVDLGLPERRKRFTSSRKEEEVDAQVCPCGKAVGSRTHIVGECEMYRRNEMCSKRRRGN